MLLEKINSTSTLGSVLAEPHTIQPLVTNGTPRGSEENSGPSRSHRSLFKADIAPANGDETPPADSHELSASLLTAPRNSWSSDLSQEISTPPPIPIPSILAPPAGIQPTPSNPHDSSRSSAKPPKRYGIAKAAKKTAKGAGIALSVAFAAALFPISVPMYLVYRRRMSRRMMMPPAVCSMDEHWLPSRPEVPYHSMSMAAELPGPYELPGSYPEIALVGRLLNTGADREGPRPPVMF